MGGMQTWIWAQKYPDFMDVAVPMASLPTEMSGRNWMMRRLIIDSIRNDPEWMNGNYTKQPRSLQFASVFYGIATNGGNQALYKAAPTREKADELLNQRLSAPFRGDANDLLYQWDSSRDYNASPGLERIQAALLGDQLGGRRAQSAGTRAAGPRDQAREKRPRAADSRRATRPPATAPPPERDSGRRNWRSCCKARRAGRSSVAGREDSCNAIPLAEPL